MEISHQGLGVFLLFFFSFSRGECPRDPCTQQELLSTRTCTALLDEFGWAIQQLGRSPSFKRTFLFKYFITKGLVFFSILKSIEYFQNTYRKLPSELNSIVFIFKWSCIHTGPQGILSGRFGAWGKQLRGGRGIKGCALSEKIALQEATTSSTQKTSSLGKLTLEIFIYYLILTSNKPLFTNLHCGPRSFSHSISYQVYLSRSP